MSASGLNFPWMPTPSCTFYGLRHPDLRNALTNANNVVTYDCVVGVTNADYKLKLPA